jgi:hypothetical protein
MPLLEASIFTGEGIDGATHKRLEDCAAGGNETLTHIAHGQRGEHVRRVQVALSRIKDAERDLGIPDFSVNGIYDPRFALAVEAYKRARDIRNTKDRIDDIVGVKTIKSLDKDLRPSKPKTQPGPPPEKPAKPNVFPKLDGPNCVGDETCPTATQFEVRMIAMAAAGDVLEGAVMDLRFRDIINRLTATYRVKAVGLSLGPAVSGGAAGGPTTFRVAPTRITRFGPVALIGGSSALPIQGSPSITGATLSHRPEGANSFTLGPIIKIDTGPFTLAGANVDFGSMTLLNRCRKEPGASREP